MKPETTQDILELMSSSIDSAVLGTAMELGLFWLLDRKPLLAANMAQALNIPFNRCYHWLQILYKLGLLESNAEGYTPSAIAREAILKVQSQDTWAFQAREERESALFVRDLALNISRPMSAWETQYLQPTDYFQHIQEDPGYASHFTRKLYEIHLQFAEQLAGMLDVRGVKSLLDLGGGSGVVSFALLRKQYNLTSVVVDVENVCRVGYELALENKLENRITYLPADLLKDDLPTGFDMVLLCDVGLYSKTFFQRIYTVLNVNGQFVIIDKFAPNRTNPPPSRLSSAFLASLGHPAETIEFTTVEDVQARLQQAGFRSFSVTQVPHEDNLPWNIDWSLLEARK